MLLGIMTLSRKLYASSTVLKAWHQKALLWRINFARNSQTSQVFT